MREQKKAQRAVARSLCRKDETLHTVLSPVIRDRIAAAPLFHEAERVALFCGREFEVELRPLWALRPAHCVFPRVNPDDKSMTFYSVEHLEDLRPGHAQILEPPPDTSRAVSGWRRSDLVLVPGLIFDPRGARLGSGQGYYDRFLARVPAHRWGVCFAHQISKERLAQEATDARMEVLVSELGIIPCDG